MEGCKVKTRISTRLSTRITQYLGSKQFKQLIWLIVKLGIAAGVLFLFLGYMLGKFLVTDLSLEPILPGVDPEIKKQYLAHHPGVHLVSYADGPEVFLQNQNVLAASAANKGIDFILNYRRANLDPKFVQQHAEILRHKKGAGFWLWKPWVILHTLESIPENDVLIYTDVGVLFRKPILPLVALAQQHEIILLEYSAPYFGKPINVIKREIFKHFDCDTTKCHYGRHIWAGVLILRNTAKSRAFIQSWLDYCCNKKLVNDDLDPSIKQHPEFEQNYHDESLLNMLFNTNPTGKYIITAEDFFNNYATWHHRHVRCKQEKDSLLMAQNNVQNSRMYRLENDLLNNMLIKWLRSLMVNPFIL